MGYTVNSIIIKKEMNELFEIINDVMVLMEPVVQWQQDVQQELIL